MQNIHVCIIASATPLARSKMGGSSFPDTERVSARELLTSLGNVFSEEISDHFSWVLEEYEKKFSAEMAARPGEFDVKAVCRWLNDRGGGGPDITQNIMRELVRLRLECEIIVE